MIEVALAVLVLAVGVVSVYVLFTTGLENVQRATEETQAAMFADNAFNALEAASVQAAEGGATNAWENFWLDFREGVATIKLPAGFAWEGPPILKTSLLAPLTTLVFTNAPSHALTVKNIIDHALRYTCAVDVSGPAADASVTNRADVMLQVWPGEFGPTNSVKPFVFYREFRRPDDL